MTRTSLFPTSFLLVIACCRAAVRCSSSLGGGVCPSDNTCCPVYNANGQLLANASSCIPPNSHIATAGPGVCCGRSLSISPWGQPVSTGCPAGYRCASRIDIDGKINEYCSHVGNEEDVDVKKSRKLLRRSGHNRGTVCSNQTDAIHPPSFPRYHLCQLNREALEAVHGFPTKGQSNYELAYYSNMGSISEAKPDVRFIFIAIHGSSRIADDYLCAAVGTIQLQSRYTPDSVLVVSPHFLVPEDVEPDFKPTQAGALPLRWNETYPIEHTWRYGAESIRGGVSSFDTIDSLLDHFILDQRYFYPNLEAIAIAGHSAGGQFVQRYALLSSHTALDAKVSQTNTERIRNIQVRLVAANPRSYCYLDDQRYVDDEYKRPYEDKIQACPRFNQFQWGLDDGGDVVAPYRDRAIELAGGIDSLRRRFLERNVTYLAGTKDILPLGGMCEDDLFQGGCRLDRAHHFFDSLALFGAGEKSAHHQLHEVAGSNHDHTFMFQLSVKEIFG